MGNVWPEGSGQAHFCYFSRFPPPSPSPEDNHVNLDACVWNSNEGGVSTPRFDVVHRNPLDTEGVSALQTDGWLPLFRLHGICNERLETRLGAPFESAVAALLYAVRSVIPRSLITSRTVVKIKQDMVLAVDTGAFIAFDW